MNVAKIGFKNLRYYKYNSILVVCLVAFGFALMSISVKVGSQVDKTMYKNAEGVDFVLCAKGSRLQAVLANLYHVDKPLGNLEVKKVDMLMGKNPLVKSYVKLAYGDNLEGHRILGTDHAYLDLFRAQVDEGELWGDKMEATLGSAVASSLGLKIGDSFYGTHGISANGHVHEDKAYKVVGVLEPTGKVIDQLVLCSIESVWFVHEEVEHNRDDHEGHHNETEEHEEEHDHDHEGHDYEAEEYGLVHEGHVHEAHEHHDHEHHHHDHDDHDEELGKENQEYKEMLSAQQRELKPHEEITAVLVKLDSTKPTGIFDFPKLVEKVSPYQAVRPGFEIAVFQKQFAVAERVLGAIGIAILALSFFGIVFSIMASLQERIPDLAVLKILGASRWQLSQVLLWETGTLGLIGTVCGLVLSRMILALMSYFLYDAVKLDFVSYALVWTELVLAIVVIGATKWSAVIPLWRISNKKLLEELKKDV